MLASPCSAAGMSTSATFETAGISAPISISFLNAIRLERAAFIATISVFFVAMAVTQIPLLAVWGVLTPQRALLSAAALLPLVAGMPLGALLARRFSKTFFDRLILVLLALIAARLVLHAVL